LAAQKKKEVEETAAMEQAMGQVEQNLVENTVSLPLHFMITKPTY